MKRFEYDKTLYFLDVPVTGVVSLIVFLIAIGAMITNRLPALMGMVELSPLQFWNAGGKSDPERSSNRRRHVDSFYCSFKRVDDYNLPQLDSFRFVSFNCWKMYLRMNGGGLLKGAIG